MLHILAAAEQVKLWHYWITPAGMPYIVALAGIMSGTIYALANLTYRHRERMANIEHGIDPDHKPDLQV
jgi:hypothetical protein